ncbi:MAG: alkaline phosphatase family protein [candidate division WOR-3 bacterium]|nr:MAG: alkaline phosphatase family protein [candidate division WOR-3 bacterium]
MHLPNYIEGSIVNLISSLLRAYGVKNLYRPVRGLPIEELQRSTNIILFVIDGLGYEFLKHYGADTVLHRYMQAKITSVFPSTTATGITTFVTGKAPAQHAITGWFMLLKEIGTVVKILPFYPRHGGDPLDSVNITPDYFLTGKTIFERIGVDSYYLTPSFLCDSAYTRTTSRGAQTIYHSSLQDCLDKMARIISSGKNKKCIYAYWAEFDAICHEFGTESTQARTHVKDLDQTITKFIDSIKGSSTSLLVTSDHGLIDTNPQDCINMRDHPRLAETLTLPLCGEPRVTYCYVRPSRAGKFREYVTSKLARYCTMHSSTSLIKKRFFGLHEPNERLFERVGDYVLIARKNYIIRDFVTGEREHFLRANHGGVSREEMYVPLINIKC